MVIVGCGYLANIVADALLDGFTQYDGGVYSSEAVQAERLARRCTNRVVNVRLASVDELLALNPTSSWRQPSCG